MKVDCQTKGLGTDGLKDFLISWNILLIFSGTTATFRGYGLCCAIVLAAFIFINFYRIDTGFVSELPQTEDPHQVQ